MASVVSNETGVYLSKMCGCKESKNDENVKIAADYNWYMQRIMVPREIGKAKITTPVKQGCPFDCGICDNHAVDILLPVFSITNDCNLDCPICFTYNRQDKHYYKSVEEVRQIVAQLVKQKDHYDCIDITGGEPTLHPQLFEVIEELKNPAFKRILLNTNGLTIAKDREFAERIKESGVQCVLSLNTFDAEKSTLIHGSDISRQKLETLRMMEELDIPVTLLCVAIKGLNEDDIGAIAHTWLRKSFVKSITIQNVTFTGENGSQFSSGERITLDEVEDILVETGDYNKSDFFPLPNAHAMCYSLTWAIVHEDTVLPLTRIIKPEILQGMFNDSYLLSAEADMSEHFMNGVNELWSQGADEGLIVGLKAFIRKLYPADRVLNPEEREVIAQDFLKPVYIHSHMDEENFDLDRVSSCADVVPDEAGSMIPACSYNLIYRERDERFWADKNNETLKDTP